MLRFRAISRFIFVWYSHRKKLCSARPFPIMNYGNPQPLTRYSNTFFIFGNDTPWKSSANDRKVFDNRPLQRLMRSLAKVIRVSATASKRENRKAKPDRRAGEYINTLHHRPGHTETVEPEGTWERFSYRVREKWGSFGRYKTEKIERLLWCLL